MEELLKNIEGHAGEHVSIRTACQKTFELFGNQQGLIRDPAYELRASTFYIVRLCLESKHNRLINYALGLCHQVLKDDRFRSDFPESESDSQWLISQLLLAIDSISRQHEDTQVELLKVNLIILLTLFQVLLNVACGGWQLNGRLVISVLSLCGDSYEEGNSSVRAAAQAAACQILRSFVSQIEEDPHFFIISIPVLKYICSKIDETEKLGRNGHGLLFLLECLRTVLCSLPLRAQSDVQLTTSLWQKVTPSLISVLGTPRVDKEFKSYGPGRSGLASTPSYCLLHARTVYGIAAELVRLVGSVASLRPMLECLYHRMLLYPAPQHRLDALQAVGELLRNSARLAVLAGPLLPPGPSFDLSLLRLIMDSIEECSRAGPAQITAAVSVVYSFLNGIWDLSEGVCVPAESLNNILEAFPSVRDAEYVGPSSYQASRLPDTYQHSSNAADEPESSSENESDDWDSDFEEKSPQSDTETEIVVGSDCERQFARHFLVALKDLLPALVSLKSCSQLDKALQEFASQYCQGAKSSNGDGIYLATLMTFLFDLALCRSGYYKISNAVPILSEDQFVKKVHMSGGLVYLSSTWLREVYQGIVSGSLLTDYFDTESNCPLINLLTGLGTREPSCEFLWDARRLLRTETPSVEVSAGRRLARRLLSCSWPSIVAVLSMPVMRPGLKQAHNSAVFSLQIAAKLCNILGMQEKSARVLGLLCTASCRKVLSAEAAVGMELMLTLGLELGSHCANCWPPILKVALHVKRLEHAAFSSGNSLSTPVGLPTLEDDSCFLRTSGSQTVSELVSGCDLLSAAQTAQILCLLSQHVDNFFEEAAAKLNLRSLDTLVRAICLTSNSQIALLHSSASDQKAESHLMKKAKKLGKNWFFKWTCLEISSAKEYLLINPLGELINHCARSTRPLVHLLRLWQRAGPCLANAACHKDRIVSKRAVELIHTVLTSVLSEFSELPLFHINEALFKPFDFLLRAETCDLDVQDQVVSCICEFVETTPGELKSGWRTLFGALKGIAGTVFSNPNRPDPILEVFSLFFANENPAVFTDAAIDCISCLICHAKVLPRERALSCLVFLKRCEEILTGMLSMTQTVVFSGSYRCQLTDFDFDVLKISELVNLNPVPEDLKNLTTPDPIATKESLKNFEMNPSLNDILKVWSLLIEGLQMAVLDAPYALQPHLLDAVFLSIQNLLTLETDFGLYCLIRIILPGIQLGLRRPEFSNSKGNLPYALGLLTDLAVLSFNHLQDQNSLTELLRRLLLILVEACWHPCTSATAPSCFRHFLLSLGDRFIEEQWRLLVLSFYWCLHGTSTPLRQLMMAFSPKSNSYYGDSNQVRVAARKDSVEDVRGLARQIFLLPLQREEIPLNASQTVTYTFLITTGNPEPLRLPVRTIIASLITQQSLLQAITTFLLKGSKFRLPGVLYSTSETGDEISVVNCLPLGEIEKLINLLEILHRTARQFDSRPGLKFLMQRVLQFERAANLYSQYFAALSLEILILLEVCFNHQTEHHFFQKLRDLFNEICEIHADDQEDTDEEPQQGLYYLDTELDTEEKPWENAKELKRLEKACRRNFEKPFSLSDFAEDSGGEEEEPVEELKPQKVQKEEKEPENLATGPTVPPEIEAQRKTSFAKDGEARRRMQTELLSAFVHLVTDLEDDLLRLVLPFVFSGIRRLAACSKEPSIKQSVADLFRRVAHLYGFDA